MRCEADDLPCQTASADKVRYDRVFQHLDDPVSVLREAHRVLKPSGIVQVIDTDYLSMTMFSPDIGLERIVVDCIAHGRIPNAAQVRRLPAMLEEANFTLRSVSAYPQVVGDYETARQLIRFDVVVDELLAMNRITDERHQRWKRCQTDERGTFNLVLNQLLIMAVKG